MATGIDGFTFFRSYFEAVSEMDDSVKLEVLTAIITYGLDGIESALSNPISRAIFSIAKPNLDSSRESVISGKRGGRPKQKPPFSENKNPPFPNSETNKNKKKNKELEEEKEKKDIGADKPPKHTCFSPPSVEAVKAYCLERKNQVDPEKFVTFYESKGWMIGKNKMRDWKAAVRTWEKGDDGSGKLTSPTVGHGQAEGRWGKLQSVQLD